MVLSRGFPLFMTDLAGIDCFLVLGVVFLIGAISTFLGLFVAMTVMGFFEAHHHL